MTESLTQGSASGPDAPTPIKAIPVRHPGRWVAVVVIAVLTAMAVHTIAFSYVDRGFKKHDQRFEWYLVKSYLFDARILHGVERTLLLTVVCMAIGIVLGVILAVMRLSPNPIVAGSSWFYIYIFRGTPVLMQIFIWYFIAVAYPHLTIGVPFADVTFAHIDMTSAISKFTAAMLGLGLNEAAYMAEIVRAGILSVDEGQTEAASALGMSRMLTMRRIVLPQAMRIIIPPTGNETISMLKATSLASVIAYSELLYAAQLIYAQNFRQIPLLITVALWYLAITTVLYVGQYYLERHFARGSVRNLPPTPWQRIKKLATLRREPVSFETANTLSIHGGHQ